MAELTVKQRHVLEFIVEYQQRCGFPPSIREMMNEFHVSSTNGVCCHLKSLKKKGVIAWEHNLARSIRVIDPQRRGIPVVELETIDRS